MQDSINGAKGIVLIYFAVEASPRQFGDTRKRIKEKKKRRRWIPKGVMEVAMEEVEVEVELL